MERMLGKTHPCKLSRVKISDMRLELLERRDRNVVKGLVRAHFDGKPCTRNGTERGARAPESKLCSAANIQGKRG
eukprot:709526-Rhodomonas_salina.2